MIVSLTGPSGIGKGYLRNSLLAHFPFLKKLVWLTTRPLRPNELSQSSNRKTVSISEFHTLEANRELLLVQNIHGYLYGLLKKDLALCAEGTYLTEFQIDNLKEALGFGYPMIAIALLPKTMDLLKQRLAKRDTENALEVEQRLAIAEMEMRKILDHQSLFTVVVTIDESSEHQISDYVIDFLTPMLQRSSK